MHPSSCPLVAFIIFQRSAGTIHKFMWILKPTNRMGCTFLFPPNRKNRVVVPGTLEYGVLGSTTTVTVIGTGSNYFLPLSR